MYVLRGCKVALVHESRGVWAGQTLLATAAPVRAVITDKPHSDFL